jgi:putative ABC transport system permease protein
MLSIGSLEQNMPDWKREIRALLTSLNLDPRDEERVVEELAEDAAQRYEVLLGRGVPEEEAKRIVLNELNGDQLRTELRPLFRPPSQSVAPGSVESGSFMSGIGRDLRLAFRQLRLNPLFALVAIISLALGVGANTAIFQLIDAVIMRSLPVPDPQQLANVSLFHEGRIGSSVARQHNFSTAMWEQLRQKQAAFSAIAAWSTESFALGQGGEAHYAQGLWVSGSFFNVLQINPALGRLITPNDDREGCGIQGVVLSYAFWQRNFGGRTNVIGSRLSLDQQPFEVIGVTPASFTGLEVGRSFDVALPLCSETTLHSVAPWTRSSTTWWLDAIGRLTPGWSLKRASAELASISPGVFAATLPSSYDAIGRRDYLRFTMRAVPAATGESPLRQAYQQPLWLLLGISGLVLLIACANLANLMLARASARQREMALRLSLGASQARVIRQLVVESLLLAVLGAAAGAGAAQILIRSLIHAIRSDDPSVFLSLAIDWRIILFTAGLAVLSCLLFGVAPALQASHADPSTVLRTSGHGLTEGREHLLLRRGLIVAQIALSLLLVATALLFVRSFQNLVNVNVGFQTKQILVADFDLSQLKIPLPGLLAAKRTLLNQIRALPGVRGAAEAAIVPVSGNGWNDFIDVPGTAVQRALCDFNSVTDDYFRTLEIPFVNGRTFNLGDTVTSPPVAIVNQAFAKKYLGSGDPVGKTFHLRQDAGKPDKVFRVIGLVGNTKENDLREAFSPLVFVDQDQDPQPDLDETIVIRSSDSTASLIDALKHIAANLSPAIVLQLSVMREDVMQTLGRERLMAELSGFYGALAALLAAVGLYGIMSWTVIRRRGEIGVRMALGASRRRVLNMIMREALTLLVAGLSIGTLLVIAAGHVMGAMLFGLKPTNAFVLLLAMAGMMLVTIAASLLPAKRAIDVQPMDILREE